MVNLGVKIIKQPFKTEVRGCILIGVLLTTDFETEYFHYFGKRNKR